MKKHRSANVSLACRHASSAVTIWREAFSCACGELSAEHKERMLRMARAFRVEEASTTVPNLTVVASARKETQAKAS